MNTSNQNADNNKTENEFLNSQNLNNMKNVTMTKADDQNIEKTGETMNDLDNALQKQPDKVAIRQREIEARLMKLQELNNTVMGRLFMGSGNKKLVEIGLKADQEGLEIIRKSGNDNLSALMSYQTRYLKTILHNLTLIGESNIVAATQVHYDNAKMVLHDKLLNGMEEMTVLLEGYEGRAINRPAKFKKAMLDAADLTLSQWCTDFDQHVKEFSDLLKKTFSR